MGEKKEVNCLKIETCGTGKTGSADDIKKKAFGVKKTWEPIVDLFESDSDVFLYVELPGVLAGEIKFFFSDHEIILRGKKPQTFLKGRLKHICIERPFGDFERIVKIPTAINPRAVKAQYANGILKLKLPKIEEKRNNLVEIPLNFEDF